DFNGKSHGALLLSGTDPRGTALQILVAPKSRGAFRASRASAIVSLKPAVLELDGGPMSALGQRAAPQKIISALTPKADMCGAKINVRYESKAASPHVFSKCEEPSYIPLRYSIRSFFCSSLRLRLNCVL